MPDGSTKYTCIAPDGYVYVNYKKGELEKHIDWFKDRICSYEEFHNNKGFCVDFSMDGSVRNIEDIDLVSDD